jgi:hypothetical protein
VETVTSIRYPGSFRTEVKLPGRSVAQVFHNGEFWIQSSNGVRQAPPGVADDLRANVQRDTIGLLLGLLDRKVTASRVADVTVGGRAMPAIEVTGRVMQPLTVVFDPASGLIVLQRYIARQAADGSKMDTEEAFSDFRDVAGLQVPFAAVVRLGGTVTLRRTVRSVEYNVALDPALFSRPS